MNSIPLWTSTPKALMTHPLANDLSVDVCIIGAGISGLSTAYFLQKEGKKVCILESGEIACGQTGRSTAQCVTALDERYYVLEKIHGFDGAKLAAQSHQTAVDQIEAIVQLEGIDCDLSRVDGYLFSGAEQSSSIIYRELEATQRMGLHDVYLVDGVPISSLRSGPALCFPNQVQLNPLQFTQGLAQRFIDRGGEIYTRSHVIEIKGGGKSSVKTMDGYTISASSIVVATHTPVNDLFAIHTKQASYRTYVIGVQVPKGSVPKGLYWDTEDPYHYIRLQEDENDPSQEILIVGGEDHKTGQNSDPFQSYARLEQWTRDHFPQMGSVHYRWSGQIMEPVDGLAYLGHNPMDRSNVYVITGDSGNGMTHSMIGALLVTDQIMERKNEWEELYQPSRVSVRAIKDFVKENLNVIKQYSDWFTETPFSEAKNLSLDEGGIFRKGLQMVAAYRNPDGHLEVFSAACPHLGGVVRWNDAEKSWDCPCHGSRFDSHGKVIDGPACKHLSPLPSEPMDEEKVEPRIFDFVEGSRMALKNRTTETPKPTLG